MTGISRALVHVVIVMMQAITITAWAQSGGDPQKGRLIVASRQQGLCLLCHSAPIPEERFQGNLAPNLAQVVKGKSADELKQALIDPSINHPGTIMPAYYKINHTQLVAKNFQEKTLLSMQQIDDVVAYLITLQKP